MINSRPDLLSRQQVVSLSQSSCVSPVELTDGRGGEGVGEEPNHSKLRHICEIDYRMAKRIRIEGLGRRSITGHLYFSYFMG
jgi:hypothetical protein